MFTTAVNGIATGDLISYRPVASPLVKGKATALFEDVFGPMVCLRVTSRTHPLYAAGTELTLDNDFRIKLRKANHNGGSQAES